MRKSKIRIKEIWKKIKNYPYTVSNYGRVKRNEPGSGTYVGKKLKLQLARNGYIYTTFSRYSKLKHFYVHRLVAEAFLGKCPKGYEVNHKDGDKEHNYYKNLEYIKHSKNMKHAGENGLMKRGELHHNSKLTEKEVLKIRKLYRNGEYKQKELAKKFNVSYITIHEVVRNKKWKHI